MLVAVDLTCWLLLVSRAGCCWSHVLVTVDRPLACWLLLIGLSRAGCKDTVAGRQQSAQIAVASALLRLGADPTKPNKVAHRYLILLQLVQARICRLVSKFRTQRLVLMHASVVESTKKLQTIKQRITNEFRT